MYKKTKTTTIIFISFVIVITLDFGSSYATTLNISPTTGPVGTSVTSSGTGYTPTGTILVSHNNQAANGTFPSFVFVQSFLGLPSGDIIQKIGLKIFDLGLGTQTTI